MTPLRAVWLGSVSYAEARKLQTVLAEARRAGSIDDTLLMLEHPPVYTMGRNGDPAHLKDGERSLVELGAEYHEVDRGGSVTFHGPGQLVAYPIIALAEAFPIPRHPLHGDVLRYLRALEEALVATVSEWGVRAVQRPTYTGIWIEPGEGQGWRKLAAIGVKLARGVTTHGVALNVSTDLSWFSHVVPCGIPDATMASLSSLTGSTVTVHEVGTVFAGHAARMFGREPAPPGDALADCIRDAFGVLAKAD